MPLVENQKSKLPVKAIGIMIDRGRPYLTVEYEGNSYQVQAYKFQKANVPKELECIYKDGQWKQDLQWLLPQIYKVGETYVFRVLSERYNGMQTLFDDTQEVNHRVVTPAGNPLKRGSMVKCRVDGYVPGNLKLTILSGNQPQGQPVALQAISPDEVMALAVEHASAARLLRRVFKTADALEACRSEIAEGNARWVLSAVDVVETVLPRWLAGGSAHVIDYVKAYAEVCTRLIENSSYFSSFNAHDRKEARARISRAITHALDYVEALTLLEGGNAEQFVVSVVNSLSTTGYIYQPERKMRVVMALLGLRPALVRTYIADIFRAIMAQHDDKEFMSLFRDAFIEMLDIYISTENRSAGHSDRSNLRDMVTAIAMLMLLTAKIDFPHWGLYRAMLYRHAASFNRGNANHMRRLIEKAYNSLMDRVDSRLEFSWSDLENITMLCTTKLTARTDSEPSSTGALFDGGNGVVLRLHNDTIEIGRSDNPATAVNVLPPHLLPESNIRIMLPDKLKEKVASSTTDMGKISRMWNELFVALTEERMATVKNIPTRKQRPAVGDTVTIRVVGYMANERQRIFNCEIEDPLYMGSGQMDIVDVVGYHVNASDYTFTAGEGEQLLLPAVVTQINDDDTLTFSVRKGVAQKIYDMASELRDSETTVKGIITEADKNPLYYLGISEEGFTFSMFKRNCPGLQRFSEVEFKVVKVDRDFNKPDTNIIVNAQLMRRLDTDPNPGIYFEEAMSRLMYAYAKGKTYVPTVETQELTAPDVEYSMLDEEHVAELMRIVDGLSQIHPEKHAVSYGYLALARILAMLITDTVSENNFALRMRLLKAITDFAETGDIPASVLKAIEQDTLQSAAGVDSAVETLLVQLKVLSHLGAPWDQCGYLHETAQRSESLALASLSRQVLAYNLLQGIHQTGTERRNIKKEIFSALNLKPATADSVIPQESDVVERKSSLIFPADSDRMQPDEARQVAEIMGIICGFLNTAGGTLYVGVRDNGDVSGLHNDFKYLNDNFDDYDLNDVQDKFRVHFANGVTRHFGATNNGVNLSEEHIRGDFDNIDGKWIYVVTVKPSATAVALTDGTMYVRNDTTNRRISSPQEQRLFAQRRMATRL